MGALVNTAETYLDATIVALAREIAIDLYPVETILKQHDIAPETWSAIQRNPRFQQFLENEIKAWNGALNTQQRVKLKAASVIEEFLPEAHHRLHGPDTLTSKVELAKLVSRLAEMGMTGVGAEGVAGDKFSVTINLGADNQLRIEGKTPPKTIDAEVVG